MIYEKELDFLRDTLQKCHIQTAVVSPRDPADLVVDMRLRKVLDMQFDSHMTVEDYLGSKDSVTKYIFVDEFKLCHVYIYLSDLPEQKILFIGPYLSTPVSKADILEFFSGVDARTQKFLEEYYSALPHLTEDDPIFTMIDTFCEHIWRSPSFAIVEIHKGGELLASPINGNSHNNDFDDILAHINMMEMRYSFENELIRAVTLGQQHKKAKLMAYFGENTFEKRISDSLRNGKNYCIIMNTLLRKAAEQGGVHPIYIDRVSSDFALKIERAVSTSSIPELMKEMFSSYCRLVYNNSIKNFSPIVQRAVLIIDSDISAEISLSSLAENQKISPGYLATVFKKETGKTISEYIREKRIKHAMYLLDTTKLQIQTVAQNCGIMDVQYFSKIFKKETGKSPREYRLSSR